MYKYTNIGFMQESNEFYFIHNSNLKAEILEVETVIGTGGGTVYDMFNDEVLKLIKLELAYPINKIHTYKKNKKNS